LIGGALYYFGGYSLPFYFFAVLTIICLPYIRTMEINSSGEDDEDEGFFKYLFEGVIKILKIKKKF